MIEVENTVVIDKPAAAVFGLVGDPIRDPEWHFDVVEASPAANGNGRSSNGKGRVAPGTRFKWVFDYMGEGRQDADVEVKAYEPDRRLDVLAVAGPLVQTISFRLEPVGEFSTLLTRTLSLTHDEIPPHMEEVMKPRIQNRSAQYLARLRQVLEDGPVENGFSGGSCACCEG
ncbi:MAG: SRPBCC family protein [Actinomycetota bacterium]